MSAMNSERNFEALCELVGSTTISRAPGKLLYSSQETLQPGKFYVLGFNPGGNPFKEDQTVIEHLVSTPAHSWSEYTQGRWMLHNRLQDEGKQNRQLRIQEWARRLQINLMNTFSSNVVFAREATVEKTKKDPLFITYLNESALIHGFLIDIVRPQKVICFGGDAYRAFLKIEENTEFASRSTLSSRKGDYEVIQLPHFSIRSSDAEFVESAVAAMGAPIQTPPPVPRDFSAAFPVVILQDRYDGTYSGGSWLAIEVATALENGAYRIVRCLEDGPHGDDTEAALFWGDPPDWIAAGNSPNEAADALLSRSRQLGRDETHEL